MELYFIDLQSWKCSLCKSKEAQDVIKILETYQHTVTDRAGLQSIDNKVRNAINDPSDFKVEDYSPDGPIFFMYKHDHIVYSATPIKKVLVDNELVELSDLPVDDIFNS